MSVYSRGWQRRRLSAAGRLAAASGNHSGNHAQVPIPDLKSVAHRLAPPQFFAAGEYHVLDPPAAALLRTGDRTSVVSGKRVSFRVSLSGSLIISKKNNKKQ